MQDFAVSFDSNGNLNYQNYDWPGTKTEPNHSFSDTLEYTGYFSATGGNSHIKFKSLTTSREYHMFMSDFDEIIAEHRFINNQVVGVFFFCKKGNSQGIRLNFNP
jgi:hypothetical protein